MDDRKNGLTIFLLREDRIGSFREELLQPNDAELIPIAAPLEGSFLPFPPVRDRQPDWVSAVSSLLTAPIQGDMSARSPGGLLAVRRQNRTFVLTFGHAWQKLEDRWLEQDFGLRVALNVIPRDELIEIKAEQIFAKWHLASERAPRAASVNEFGVDFDRDLVAVIEGQPKSRPILGSRVRGSTSLRVNLPITGLGALLDACLAEFLSDAYKNDWPEIDKISPLKDDVIIALLEEQLDAALSSEESRRRIVMFTPYQRRGESIFAESYVFGRMSTHPTTRPYLTIESWVSELARTHDTPSVALAKKYPVRILESSEGEPQSCKVFDCFGYEIDDGARVYILSSGIWYEVVSDFVAQINDRIAQIPSCGLRLAVWNRIDDEGEYNSLCATDPSFLNCDAKNFYFGGGHSQLEFCDLVHLESRTLIFCKLVSKSSGMSHLLEQVRRTSDLLFGADGAYRARVLQLFGQHHPAADVAWLRTRPRREDWNLCMVSLGKPSADLPFFAKCGLAKLSKELVERGHRVSFEAV
jgi:uncharacterized protein (TIGR04141 family)